MVALQLLFTNDWQSFQKLLFDRVKWIKPGERPIVRNIYTFCNFESSHSMGVESHRQDKEEGLKDLCRMMIDNGKVTGSTALAQCNNIRT